MKQHFFWKLLILIGSFCSYQISIRFFLAEKIQSFEYPILMLFATSSMLCMVSSYDLLSFYLTVELQSLSFYVLAASKRQSEFSTEAGLKYFLLSAFSSGILLFGSSLVYGFTGCTHFGDLALLLTGTGLPLGESNTGISAIATSFGGAFSIENTSPGLLIGILFIAIGFLFKLSAAPFHMWAPDVYEGAPTAITGFFSIVPKIAFLGVFIRLFVISFHEIPWQPIILLCSIFSMIIGSFGALSQKKIKRVFAFSAIGHVGYILMGTSCSTIEGIQSVLIYTVLYVLMTICVFTVILSLKGLRTIQDLSLLSHSNPAIAFAFAICLFSMAGVPPLAGFCSKFFLFFAALSSDFYVPAFVGIATSCVSCFYYIRLIKIMYFEKKNTWIEFEIVDKQKAFILSFSLFAILTFFLYPTPLFVTTQKIAILLAAQ